MRTIDDKIFSVDDVEQQAAIAIGYYLEQRDEHSYTHDSALRATLSNVRSHLFEMARRRRAEVEANVGVVTTHALTPIKKILDDLHNTECDCGNSSSGVWKYECDNCVRKILVKVQTGALAFAIRVMNTEPIRSRGEVENILQEAINEASK